MSSLKINSLNMSTILTVVRAQNASGATGTSQIGYAVLRESRPAGNNSAITFNGTTPITRQINDVSSNGLNITLSQTPNWTFTIQEAGTYAIRARACTTPNSQAGFATQGYYTSRLYLYNNSNQVLLSGDSMVFGQFNDAAVNNYINHWPNLSGILTLPENSVVSLRQHTTSNVAGVPYGGISENVNGREEVYAVIEIQKLA